MSLTTSRREVAGLHAFRLHDIDPNVRLRAAQKIIDAIRLDGDFLDTVDQAKQLTAAALAPSDRVYWISEDAWKRVMG